MIDSRPLVLIFDSGFGGLSVYREIAAVRPDARYVYVADDQAFPYNGLSDADLVARVLLVLSEFVAEQAPDLIVVACNTASTLVLSVLRQSLKIPIVGTVPAIKPACAASITKMVSVLGTEATIKRDYTQALIRDFAGGCAVTLVGSAHLANLAEAALRGREVNDEAMFREIAPCFVTSDGRKTDTIVLACTHYPLLLDPIQRLSPWPVRFVDPAAAIARRVADLLGGSKAPDSKAPDPKGEPAKGRVFLTSEARPEAALLRTLAMLGLEMEAKTLV